MQVIRAFELILNQNPSSPGPNVFFTQKVCTKWTYGLLLRLQFKIKAQSFRENRKIVGPPKPRCKIGGLTGPNLSQFYS